MKTVYADEDREHDASVDRAEAAVQGEEKHQHGQPDQERHLEPHELARDEQRRDRRGDPEDEQDVEDVAAHHVPERDVAPAVHGGLDGYGQLRRARPVGDDREADHER